MELLGAQISALATEDLRIYLSGDLAAGKTTFGERLPSHMAANMLGKKIED